MDLLKNRVFSDVILPFDGGAFLKGTPEHDQRLFEISQDYAQEVRDLRDLVVEEFKKHEDAASRSLRIIHAGLTYRAAIYEGISGSAYFLRRLADKVPSLESLGLPSPMVEWLTAEEQCKGLLLFIGGQGAGKTTTASALIKSRLEKHGGHAVSFENPVEMPLEGQHGEYGRCFQKEVLSESLLEAHIEHAHRYSSPNIIYIGEIRSRYAASIVLQVALGSSQQMVVATCHGLSIKAALNRLLTWAKEKDGEVACQNLSQTLLGVIHLELRSSEPKGEEDEGKSKRILKVPEFLLVSFDDNSTAIRAKLQSGELDFAEEIRAQRNNMTYGGRIGK